METKSNTLKISSNLDDVKNIFCEIFEVDRLQVIISRNAKNEQLFAATLDDLLKNYDIVENFQLIRVERDVTASTKSHIRFTYVAKAPIPTDVEEVIAPVTAELATEFTGNVMDYIC